jgi:hypothetical protein
MLITLQKKLIIFRGHGNALCATERILQRPARPRGYCPCYFAVLVTAAAVVVTGFAAVFLTFFFAFIFFPAFAVLVVEAGTTADVFVTGAAAVSAASAIETDNTNAIRIKTTFFILKPPVFF